MVRILVIVVGVPLCFVMFCCDVVKLWAVTASTAVSGLLLVEPGVLVLGAGNVTVVENCFGVILSVEAVFAVSSPVN